MTWLMTGTLDLFDAELLDSMSVISIIISIEEKTGKRLEPTDFTRDDIKTVHNFARFLKEKVG
jgi:D-alanine--poly(phosphoribitol) ligase subunit 2